MNQPTQEIELTGRGKELGISKKKSRMVQREEERGLSMRKPKELYENHLTPSERAMQGWQGNHRKQKREKGTENLFEQILEENLPNQCKELDPRIQEVNRTPNYLNPKRPSWRLVVLKLSKSNGKERTLKAAREKKKVTYKGTPIRLLSDLSAETPQAGREWREK